MRAHSLWQSFCCAFAGLWYVLRTQRNARIHVALGTTVMACGACLPLTHRDWAVLILTIGFVFSFELLNTMVETLVDLVSPEYHPLARTAKDVAAGAVLTSALVAFTVGVLILGPPVWHRFSTQSAAANVENELPR